MKILLSTVLVWLMSLMAISQAKLDNDTSGIENQDYQPFQLMYENPIVKKGFYSLGFGAGLPYGGLGFRFGYNPINRLNTFGSLGYNFVGAGANVGIQYDFGVVKQTSFYLSGLAGYNALTLIDGAPEYNKTFYGPSFGTGIKHDSGKESGNFLQIGILLPLRSEKFYEMVDRIENDPEIDKISQIWPILITIGINMGFGDFQ